MASTVTVRADSTSLAPGEYVGEILIESPAEQAMVAVALRVVEQLERVYLPAVLR